LLCGADGVGRRRRRHLLSVVIVVHRATPSPLSYTPPTRS
jgi:hypothetical protein